jgi:hypothetical protein
LDCRFWIGRLQSKVPPETRKRNLKSAASLTTDANGNPVSEARYEPYGAGRWGDAPFLHLGERFWDAASHSAIERYHLVHLETGALTEIALCDQTYRPEVMTDLLRRSGFRAVEVFPAWAGLELYDAAEWLVYLVEK